MLKQADLISARREGQQIYYSLNTTVFQDLMTTLFDLFARGTESQRPEQQPGPESRRVEP